MRIGSLFSGAGGLDMAVEAVFGGEVIWQAEIDKSASKVLAYRFPAAPNLGDITAIDWATVESPDVLCGGFPCQDVSSAGRRAGIKDGTRSGLWTVFADAIDQLRPPIVVIENVRGLLSAQAHRIVELTDETLGNGQPFAVLRAAGAVLGDLADLGYDAQWATVAAGDVGAPHRRERVFILATDTEHAGSRRKADDARWRQFDVAGRGGRCESEGCGTPCGCGQDASYTEGNRRERWPESARQPRRSDVAIGGAAAIGYIGHRDRYGAPYASNAELLPTPRSWDCFGAGLHGDGGMDLRTTVTLLPTPKAHDGQFGSTARTSGRPIDKATHLQTIVALLPTPLHSDAGPRGGTTGFGLRDETRKYINDATAWGKYEPAIRRWESLTRPAPAPTEPNRNGNPRLAAAFSEWLMGWPAGWVTDPDIGISRNEQLRIVGNGVCPHQAAAALRYLLSVAEVAA